MNIFYKKNNVKSEQNPTMWQELSTHPFVFLSFERMEDGTTLPVCQFSTATASQTRPQGRTTTTPITTFTTKQNIEK